MGWGGSPWGNFPWGGIAEGDVYSDSYAGEVDTYEDSYGGSTDTYEDSYGVGSSADATVTPARIAVDIDLATPVLPLGDIGDIYSDSYGGVVTNVPATVHPARIAVGIGVPETDVETDLTIGITEVDPEAVWVHSIAALSARRP